MNENEEEKTPTLAEIIKANDDLFANILLQLESINSDIETINKTLKTLQ